MREKIYKHLKSFILAIIKIDHWFIQKFTPYFLNAFTQQEIENLISPCLELLPKISSADKWHTPVAKNIFRKMESKGVHITPNYYYSPIPDTRSLEESKLWNKESNLIGIDINEKNNWN